MRRSERLWARPSQPKPISPTPMRRRVPGRSRTAEPCWAPRLAHDPVLPLGRLLELVRELVELRAAGHHLHELVAADLTAVPLAEQLAPVQHDEAVAHRVGVVRVVGDEDHPHPALARLRDVAQHDPGLLHPERRGRLVQDQHLGAEVDRPRDRDRLALATRQRADRLVGVAHVDAHLGHLLAHRPLRPLDVDELDRPNRPQWAPSRGRSCARSTSAAPSPGPGRRWRCRARAPRGASGSASPRPRPGARPRRAGGRPRGS